MGRVYEATRRSDQLRVAIKYALAGSASSAEALERETRALRILCHSGVVKLHDHGMANGVPWYAMELGNRGTLQSYASALWARSGHLRAQNARTEMALPGTGFTRRKPYEASPGRRTVLPLAGAGRLTELAQLFRSLCDVVFYLHGEGCVHGDLKPSNILLTARGPVLIDFGQARIPGDDGFPSPSGGTVEYCSPERIWGAPAGPESDLYALGCIFYEVLTGHQIFAGHPCNVLQQHLSGEPLLASRWVRNLPPALDGALANLLSKDPSARSAGLPTFLDALPGAVNLCTSSRAEIR
jgi:serine/threonine protein kinase